MDNKIIKIIMSRLILIVDFDRCGPRNVVKNIELISNKYADIYRRQVH